MKHKTMKKLKMTLELVLWKTQPDNKSKSNFATMRIILNSTLIFIHKSTINELEATIEKSVDRLRLESIQFFQQGGNSSVAT